MKCDFTILLMVWSTFLMQQDGCERYRSTTALTSFTLCFQVLFRYVRRSCIPATIFFQPVHPHSNVPSIRNIAAWNNEPSPKAFGVGITDFGCFRNACAVNPRSSPTSTSMTTTEMGSTGDHNKMKFIHLPPLPP